MNKKVLFSPIGDSDPVRDSYDGSMLHIARYYLPNKIYLYFTKQMLKKKSETIQAINKLYDSKKIDVAIDVIEGAAEFAHSYDVFHNEFDPILNKIVKENPECEVLLNISSGTPQMKSALCLEVVSSHNNYKAIQVETPAKGSNAGISHGGNIDDNFDDLMENGKYITQNRCIEPNILSFRKTAMQRYIVALVDNFEYRAAYEILKDNEFLFSAEALNLLKYAVLRQDDNNEYLKMKDINNQFSFTKDSEAKKACDYYCILSNKAKTGELSYFVLLLKPLIEYIAKSYTGSIDKNEAIACLNDYYSKKINSYYIEKPSYNIEEYVAIMRHKKLDEETVNKFDEIRDYLVARNELAHDLQRVEYLDTNSALKKLRFLLKRTYGNKIKDNSLNIYDLINQKIKDTL